MASRSLNWHNWVDRAPQALYIKRVNKRHQAMTNTTYNGWTNWETWNASLWVNNDYGMYRFVLGLVNSKVTEWADVAACLSTCYGEQTPDGAVWLDADDTEMTEMLAEML